MKFRNITTDTHELRGLGVSVEPGETTPELDDGAGFVLQTDVWAAVGADAKQEQKAAVAADAAASTEGDGN